MRTRDVLVRLESTWKQFESSYAGLSEAQMLAPGVTRAWSVRDIIAHVTWWEEEALQHLPLIRGGGRPPRYSVKYGGIDAFNALMTEQRRGDSLAQVLGRHDEVHRRLIAYVETVPDELFSRETRFRRRLRLDTYAHYPIHTRAIEEWRRALDARSSRGA